MTSIHPLTQVFARKVLHVGTSSTMADVENEIRAVDKLCKHGAHENIVRVLRHGVLRNFPYYFIDMELCAMTLADYIYREPPAGESVPRFIKDAPSTIKALQIWNIMNQIAMGAAFIHSHGSVHRDLKPTNGSIFYHWVLIA